jgi:hypothetical protein
MNKEKLQKILDDTGISELLENPYVNFSEIITKLKENTGKDKQIDIKHPEVWNQIGSQFLFNGALNLAEKTYRELYVFQVNYQLENKELIHKGIALHNTGWVNRFQGRLDGTLKFTTLALIEDVLHSKGDSYKIGMAFPVLKQDFNIREDLLNELTNFSREFLKESNMYDVLPENILLEFQYKKGEIFFFSLQDNLFNINIKYFSKLIRDLKTTKSNDSQKKGKILEKIAFYLFSSIENIIIIKNKRTKDYEIDLILRNNNLNHPILGLFGEYLLVECKNWSKTVDVGQVNHFLSKMKFHNCKCGILISKKGMSGSKEDIKAANLTKLKEFHKYGQIMMEITLEDLKNISMGTNLLSILLREYENIRFDSFTIK